MISVGLVIVIIKRNIIVILMGIELILNAANINLIAFSYYDPVLIQGQMFSLFTIVIAAAEAAVAMAIAFKVYNYFATSNIDEIHHLKG